MSAKRPVVVLGWYPGDPGWYPGDPAEAIPAAPGKRPSWQDRSLCSQTDPEAFFPEKGGSTRAAKRVCRGCEVRAECLEYALGNEERWGIWGGLSERERSRMKRAAPAAQQDELAA